ncbi:MAG: peptide chain release factor N(5)-glutamine methyltransferase [Gammaproteobacteria bacterium]|nr:peptide chain release factor N(5)-glutamine methyltransferase [Gammaproteobacteria bacterium]
MSDDTEIGDLLKRVARELDTVSESPRLDAEILLGRAIDMPRAYLFAHPDDMPDDAAIARLQRTVARRLAGEPMAYITGSKEFWSMDLVVSPATLVPRPETELLVDLALREIPRKAHWRILDLGTGSGAIALAIARERPLCDIVAVELSADAIRIAEINRRQLDIANVTFLEGSWTAPVAGEGFDLVVSNPPYVKVDDDALERLASEPAAALVAGVDGLDAIRILAHDCRDVLRVGGQLALEHGADQEHQVAKLLRGNGWSEIACHNDYAGLPRVTTARRPAPDDEL